MQEKETDELLDLINEVSNNYQPMRDSIVVTSPTQAQQEEALKKGSIITGVGKNPKYAANEIVLTVMAIGPDVTDIAIGDKVILKAGVYPIIRIKSKEYQQVERYSIMGKVKGDIS